MAYEDEESKIVKVPWTVQIQGVHETIPAGEEVRIARDANSGNVRAFWSGFATKHISQPLGLSALVTEEDVAAHT